MGSSGSKSSGEDGANGDDGSFARDVSELNLTDSELALSDRLNGAIPYLAVSGGLVYMWGMGLAVDIEVLKKVGKKAKPAMIGLFCQVVINPLVLFAVIRAFGDSIPLPLQISAILMSIAPGGSSSNLLVYLSHGELEVSVIMTIVSTLFAFISMPFFLWLITSVLWDVEEKGLEVPYVNVALSAAGASIPTAFGLYSQRFFEETIYHKVIFAAVVFQVLALGSCGILYLFDPIFRTVLELMGAYPWLLAFLLNVSGLFTGYWGGRLSGLPRTYWRTIAFEVGSQNAGIIFALLSISFGSESPFYMTFIACYIITSGPVGITAMLYWRYCSIVSEEDRLLANGDSASPPNDVEDTSRKVEEKREGDGDGDGDGEGEVETGNLEGKDGSDDDDETNSGPTTTTTNATATTREEAQSSNGKATQSIDSATQVFREHEVDDTRSYSSALGSEAKFDEGDDKEEEEGEGEGEGEGDSSKNTDVKPHKSFLDLDLE